MTDESIAAGIADEVYPPPSTGGGMALNREEILECYEQENLRRANHGTAYKAALAGIRAGREMAEKDNARHLQAIRDAVREGEYTLADIFIEQALANTDKGEG